MGASRKVFAGYALPKAIRNHMLLKVIQPYFLKAYYPL